MDKKYLNDEETRIAIFDISFSDLNLDLRKRFEDDPSFKEVTVKNIIKAIEKGGIDSAGEQWFSTEKLFHILRCQSKLQNHILESIEKKYKKDIGGKQYVKLSRLLLELMDRSSKNPGNRYYQPIIDTLNDINSAPEVKMKQFQAKENKLKVIKNLKFERIKKYGIKLDELTSEKLKRGAEFHHIRAQSIYPELATFVENGIVINKKVHTEITRENICNEDDLYMKCKEKGYNIDWYFRFQEFLKKL